MTFPGWKNIYGPFSASSLVAFAAWEFTSLSRWVEVGGREILVNTLTLRDRHVRTKRQKHSCFQISVSLVRACLFLVQWGLERRRMQRIASRRRLSTKQLSKIPTKKFKKGDAYEVCAICLEDYEGKCWRTVKLSPLS